VEAAGPVARLWRQARRSRQQRPASVWRLLVNFYPVFLAGGFMESADARWYLHPFLDAFGALLPLTVIGLLATVTANFFGERRARRQLAPRPRTAYLCMALGWALVGGASALLAWAVGAKPTGPEDWIATGLVWATMICVCATLMMLGRALTAGPVRRRRGLT
jgi:polyferredoxin